VPLYEYHCVTCGAACEVILESADQKQMELICIDCGGVMKADAVSTFSVRAVNQQASLSEKAALKKGSCGHGHHCRCAIKSKHPNPFQAQIDRAFGDADSES
jgi:putative FmdB family regulatory protein